MVFGYLYLAKTKTNPPTNSKSVFQYSFPSLHSWSRLRRTNRYIYQQGEHICTPNIGIELHLMVYGYLFLAQTETTPPSNTKSVFQHSFPPLHSWSRPRRTNRYSYQLGELKCTPDIGKLLRLMVFSYLYLAKTETNPPTQNLCFNIHFHLYIHDLVLDEPIGTLTSRVNTYVPQI